MHGKRAAKMSNVAGKDWWGKRPLSGTPVSARSRTMKYWKRVLHKIERNQGKKQCDKNE